MAGNERSQGGGPVPHPRHHDVAFTASRHLRLILRADRTLAMERTLRAMMPPGARVLDAGCGSGLLSVLAVRAGAREVVGVDRDCVDLARAMAEENGVADRISIIEGDLATLGPDDLSGRFDVVIAFIYTNHMVADEGRCRLAASLPARFGTAGCLSVPNRVRYFGIPCDWPSLKTLNERADLRRAVIEAEHRFDLRLGVLEQAVAAEIGLAGTRPPHHGDYDWLPTGSMGAYRHPRRDARFLGPPIAIADFRYGNGDPVELPPQVTPTFTSGGLFSAMLWVQELMFDDRLIWSAESLSALAEPTLVQAGQQADLRLDDIWRHGNILMAGALRPA